MASATKTALKPTFQDRLWAWTKERKWYFLAFFLPAILMYIAYVRFGMYPFGNMSVLVLDMNGQYIYVYEGLRDALHGDGSVFYSWAHGLSGEFIGDIAYYVSSPFNIIIWLLPRSMILESILIVQLVKIGTAGITFLYFTRKTTGIKWINGIVFSTCYALMAYMVIQLMDQMWLDGLVLLPLIILGIRRLVDDNRVLGIRGGEPDGESSAALSKKPSAKSKLISGGELYYIIPLAIMFFAHFYIGLMIAIFCVLYFIYYVLFGSEKYDKKFGGMGTDIIKVAVRFGLFSALAAMLAAAMLIPVYNALKLGKSDFTTPDYSFKTQFLILDMLPKLLPNSYDSVRPDSMMDIYAGAIVTFLLPLFYLNTKIPARVKIGQSFLLVALTASMYIKPLDMYWHMGQVPNWIPFRYSFLFSFIIVTMGAEAFRHLDGVKSRSLGGVFAALAGIIIFLETREYSYVNVVKTLWFAVICFGIYAAIMAAMKKEQEKVDAENLKYGTKVAVKSTLSVIMLIMVSLELTYNAYNSLNAINKDVAYSKHSSYYDQINNGRKIVDNIYTDDKGLYRTDKTYRRTLSDDMAMGLRGMAHSTSVMNAQTLEFLNKTGYASSSYYADYNGATPVMDSLLGFKYILDRASNLSRPSIGRRVDPAYVNIPKYTHSYYNSFLSAESSLSKNGKPLDKNPSPNDTIMVYENKNALSIGYAASKDLIKQQDNVDARTQQKIEANKDPKAKIKDEKIFTNKNVIENNNLIMSAIVGKAANITSANPQTVQYFKRFYPDEDPILNNAYYTESNWHYVKTGDGDHTVEYRLTAQTNDTIYLYFTTRDQQTVNLWFSDQWDSVSQSFPMTGLTFLGEYLRDESYGIMKIGKLPIGTKFCVRVTIGPKSDSPDYCEITEPIFCYLDEAQFTSDINLLKQNQWEITNWSASRIEGTINMPQGKMMLTSIPYEKGWKVWVDGKKTEPRKVLDALIGIEMEPGNHTVVMSFTPNGFGTGLILCIIALGACVCFFLYTRKQKPKVAPVDVTLAKPTQKNAITDNSGRILNERDNSGRIKEDLNERDKKEAEIKKLKAQTEALELIKKNTETDTAEETKDDSNPK